MSIDKQNTINLIKQVANTYEVPMELIKEGDKLFHLYQGIVKINKVEVKPNGSIEISYGSIYAAMKLSCNFQDGLNVLGATGNFYSINVFEIVDRLVNEDGSLVSTQ